MVRQSLGELRGLSVSPVIIPDNIWCMRSVPGAVATG